MDLYEPVDRWTNILFEWPGSDVVIGTAFIVWFGRPILYRMWLWARGEHVNDNP